MSFLAVVLLLALHRFSRLRLLVQVDAGLVWLCNALCARVAPACLQLLLLLILPLLPLLLLSAVLGTVWHGLLLLPVDLLVLVWALGSGDPRALLQPLRAQWQAGNLEAASLQAQQSLQRPSHDASSLLQHLQDFLLWHSYQNFFAVLFCYGLGGAPLVLVYRVLVLLGEKAGDGLRDRARTARQALDWLPARLTALSLALAGNFTAVARVLRPGLLQAGSCPAHLIVSCGRAAAGLEPVTPDEPSLRSLDELWALLVRAAVVWYCGWALWVLLV